MKEERRGEEKEKRQGGANIGEKRGGTRKPLIGIVNLTNRLYSRWVVCF